MLPPLIIWWGQHSKVLHFLDYKTLMSDAKLQIKSENYSIHKKRFCINVREAEYNKNIREAYAFAGKIRFLYGSGTK